VDFFCIIVGLADFEHIPTKLRIQQSDLVQAKVFFRFRWLHQGRGWLWIRRGFCRSTG
jgi:hypothetical protein